MKSLLRTTIVVLLLALTNLGLADGGPNPPVTTTPPTGPEVSEPDTTDEPTEEPQDGYVEVENQVYREHRSIVGTPYALNYTSLRQPGYRHLNRITLGFPVFYTGSPVDGNIHLYGTADAMPGYSLPEQGVYVFPDWTHVHISAKGTGQLLGSIFASTNIVGPQVQLWPSEQQTALAQYITTHIYCCGGGESTWDPQWYVVGMEYLCQQQLSNCSTPSPGDGLTFQFVLPSSMSGVQQVDVTTIYVMSMPNGQGGRTFQAYPYTSTVTVGAPSTDAGTANLDKLGGWTLSGHHTFSPSTKRLYEGDGSVRRVPDGSVPGWIASEDGSELYWFDAQGRHLRTQDAITGVTNLLFTYDAASRLSAVTDADGDITHIGRDASGNPTNIVSPFGLETRLTISNGYLANIVNPASETNSHYYTATGLLTNETSRRGDFYPIAYDSLGRVSRIGYPTGGATTFADAPGFPAAGNPFWTHMLEVSPMCRTNRFVVHYQDENHTHREITAPDGIKVVSDMDVYGAGTAALPDGTSVTIEKEADPRLGMQAPVTKKVDVRLPSGMTFSASEKRQALMTGTNSPLEFTVLTNSVTVNGNTWRSVYTATNRTVTATSPEGRTATVHLDAKGRPVRGESAGLYPVEFNYDDRGRISTVTQGAGAEARITSFAYAPEGWLSTVTNQRGDRVEFRSDRIGRVTNVVMPDATTVLATYAASSDPSSVIVPGGGTNLFAYTPMYQVSLWTEPPLGTATNCTAWTWNSDHDLAKTLLPDASVVSNLYAANGRLESILWPGSSIDLSYDAQGRVSSLTDGAESTLGLSYDGSLLTAQRWVGTAVTGTVSYAYSADMAVTGLTVRANSAFSVGYAFDRDGLLMKAGGLTLARAPTSGFATNLTLGGISENLTVSGFGEPARHESRFGGTNLYGVAYGIDGLGRITNRVETVLGETNVYGYVYDLRGQLVEVTTNGAVYSRYEYDANGNRTNWTVNGKTLTATHDAQDRLLGMACEAPQETTTFLYDGNGALTNRTDGSGTTVYLFDATGELLGVGLPSGTNVTYQADPVGRRVSRAVDGVVTQRWLYIGALKPAAELDTANNVVSVFVYGTGLTPDYMMRGGAKYRFITDQVGSVRLVVDAVTGEVAQRIDYDEFGRVLRDTNPGFQPFGFQGGLYDPLTGLVEFGVRSYDNRSGRWISKDPVGFQGGMNSYVFCMNNAICLHDPTGLAVDISLVPSLKDARPGKEHKEAEEAESYSDPDEITVLAHANQWTLWDTTKGSAAKVPVDMRLLAERIKNLAKYKSRIPIRIIGCRAGVGGQNSLAAQLARELGSNPVWGCTWGSGFAPSPKSPPLITGPAPGNQEPKYLLTPSKDRLDVWISFPLEQGSR